MNDSTPTKQNFAAVMITHHPGSPVGLRVRELSRQFARLLVIDNHSGPEELAGLRSLCGEASNVQLVTNPENVGVAAALNQGCRLAFEQGFKWIASFDQDSAPAADLVSFVALECQSQHDRERIGLIGVNFRRPDGTTLLPVGFGLAGARAVITSGSLLNLTAWQAVGPFREDFFIDEVDHEYALRLRRHGWLVKVTRRVLMEHAPGSPRAHKLWGWRPSVSHHPAIRRYYMVRNRVLLAREHLLFDPGFVCGQLGRSVRETASVLLFEPEKAAKLRAMAHGWADGLRGRAGQASWQG